MVSLCSVPIELDALSRLWVQNWPDLRPIGPELRGDRERWVRFQALPLSKRYPENEQEYAEILRRGNLLLGELVAQTRSSFLVVMTVAWSDSAAPTAREPALAHAIPDADLWTSVLDERDRDDEYWAHIYVNPVDVQFGAVDPLLRLVADDETAGVIITDDRLRWLVHPYDGGFDVITHSTEERDQLRHQHGDWLPTLGPSSTALA